MQKWLIHGKETWLCQACTRELMPVIMLGTWEWLDTLEDATRICVRCRCNDYNASRFGRFRRLVSCFFPKLATANTKGSHAMRRAA